MDNSSLFTLVIIVGALTFACLTPLILLVLVAYLATPRLRGWLDRFVMPNPAGLRLEVAELRATHPGLNNDELVKKIINLHALKAGLIGGLSGLGGAITSIGLTPVDIAFSLRLQAHMIGLISYVYGHIEEDEEAFELSVYAILSAKHTRQLNRIAAQVVQQLVLRMIIRALIKLVLQSFPFLGALAGFGINLFVTQTAGRIAAEWYKKNWSPNQVKEVVGTGARRLGNQAVKTVSSVTRTKLVPEVEHRNTPMQDNSVAFMPEDEPKNLNLGGDEKPAFLE